MQSSTIIIATLGPSSEEKETIKNLIDHNADMIRLNFSWGTHEWHGGLINKIRESSGEKHIDIMQDLSGPRVQESSGHHFGGKDGEDVITEKDIADLSFGIENNVDYIAMSFVGCANDVKKLKELIKEKGGNQKVISKIERRIALKNLKEIIAESDGIIVARGDLGNEYPLEEIPFVQHQIISECNKAGKMVIVATQMLLSMVDNNTPTRAEVSDVAYAIIDGADGLLLSDETARGKYPVESISYLERIALTAEENRSSTLIG